MICRPQVKISYFLCRVTVGKNPLSVAAPGKDGDNFVLDMATSSVALGKVSGWEVGRNRLEELQGYNFLMFTLLRGF